MPNPSRLLEKCMITGISTAVFCIAVWFSFYSKFTSDTIAWITLSISTGTGIIIALIVDDKANKSHDEVLKSQDTIRDLLKKLDDTNKKHQQALDLLSRSEADKEKVSLFAIIQNLGYISDILSKILKAADGASKKDNVKLLSRVLPHLESPLNIVGGTIQQTGFGIGETQRSEINSSISSLRKFMILSTLGTNFDVDMTISNLKSTNETICNLMKQLKY